MKRKYLPTLSELVDRLSIAQLKEVFISEHKSEYTQEISDIVHDINLILKADTIDYLNFKSIEEIMKTDFKNLCTGCFNNNYNDW